MRRGSLAGEVGVSQLMVIGMVALAGVGAFTVLGTGMGTAIGNDADGRGALVAVASQAGAGEPLGAPDPVEAAAGNGPGVVVAVQAGSTNGNATAWQGVGVSSQGTTEGGDGCGWDPLCHAGSVLGDVTDFASDALGGVGDFAGWFIDTPFSRAIGGFVDGAWDALFAMGKGLLTAVWRVGWDFLVEDVLVGNLKGLAGFACKAATLGTSCKESSWNPYKETTDSLLNFAKKIPEARHALGDMLHQGSLCLNPWNGQASEDRGHACGETFVALADIVIGAKGAGKAGKLARVATKTDDLAEAGTVARVASKGDDIFKPPTSADDIFKPPASADDIFQPRVPPRKVDDPFAARPNMRHYEAEMESFLRDQQLGIRLSEELDGAARNLDEMTDRVQPRIDRHNEIVGSKHRVETQLAELRRELDELNSGSPYEMRPGDPTVQRAFELRDAIDRLQTQSVRLDSELRGARTGLPELVDELNAAEAAAANARRAADDSPWARYYVDRGKAIQQANQAKRTAEARLRQLEDAKRNGDFLDLRPPNARSGPYTVPDYDVAIAEAQAALKRAESAADEAYRSGGGPPPSAPTPPLN